MGFGGKNVLEGEEIQDNLNVCYMKGSRQLKSNFAF